MIVSPNAHTSVPASLVSLETYQKGIPEPASNNTSRTNRSAKKKYPLRGNLDGLLR